MTLTWLEDLVRRSVREYRKNDSGTEVHKYSARPDSSFLDLRYSTNRWSIGREHIQQKLVSLVSPGSNQNDLPPSQQYLRSEIARRNGVSISEVILGSSLSDLLRNIFFCIVEEGDDIVFAQPSPSIYKNMVQLHGGTFTAVPVGKDLIPRLDLFFSACNIHTKAIILNDPLFLSGIQISAMDLMRILSHIEKHQILLIIHENDSVLDTIFSDKAGRDLFRDYGKIINIRTFSEFYGIPDLNMAYAVLPAPLAREYNKINDIMQLNSFALQQSLLQLSNEAEIKTLKEKISKEKETLKYRVSEMGLYVINNSTSNIVVQTPQSDFIWKGLTEEKVLVTNGSEYSFPGHLIISVGLSEENERFITALRKVWSYLGHR